MIEVKILALLAAGRALGGAAYDMSRKPENEQDEAQQHDHLHLACAAWFDALEAVEGKTWTTKKGRGSKK